MKLGRLGIVIVEGGVCLFSNGSDNRFCHFQERQGPFPYYKVPARVRHLGKKTTYNISYQERSLAHRF